MQGAPVLPVATTDPGAGVGAAKKLPDLEDTLLVPAVVDTPPNNTRSVFLFFGHSVVVLRFF